MDTPECKQSFERNVTIEDNKIRVRAYCYEKEDNIFLYDTGDIELKKKIVPQKSSFEWRGDGKLLMTLRKANAPSFWKYLMADAKQEIKDL